MVERLYVHVSFVASCSADCSQGDACGPYSTLIHSVASTGLKQSRLFGAYDHGQSNAVFGRVSRAIEEFGFG
jgi:hypothetical protein